MSVTFARPSLEGLEERIVPAVHVWTGAAGLDMNMSTALNWDDNKVPVAADTLIYDGGSPANAIAVADPLFLLQTGGKIANIEILPTYTGKIFLDGDLTVTDSLLDAGSDYLQATL